MPTLTYDLIGISQRIMEYKMVSIFISYSHEDKDYIVLLEKFFKSAKMEESFQKWSDRGISIGSKWESEIFDAISHASAAIFLISENFLASDFIMKKEVPRVLERCNNNEMNLYPILIKPCPWKEHEWLQKIEIRPKSKPLSMMEENERSEALTLIVLEIKKLERSYQSNTQSDSNKAKLTGRHKKKRTRDLIFYDIDRQEQFEIIEECCFDCERHQFSPRFAWIFHGDEDDCPDHFFKLLKEVWLPVYLGENLLIIDNINWPQTAVNFQSLEQKILREIYKYIPGEMRFQNKIDFKTISGKLNEHPGPLIIKCKIIENQWQSNSKKNIEDFFKIFEKWPERSNGPLIIVLMIVYLKNKKGIFKRWLKKNTRNDIIKILNNKPIETFRYTKAEHFNKFALIQCSDVMHWADKKAVKDMSDEDRLNEVIDQLYPNRQEALSMSYLAKALKQGLAI